MDRDLAPLSRAPTPDGDAKARALAAAMAAFDAAGEDGRAADPEENAAAPQGIEAAARPIAIQSDRKDGSMPQFFSTVFSPASRKISMRALIAASLVVAAAAPVAFSVLSDLRTRKAIDAAATTFRAEASKSDAPAQPVSPPSGATHAPPSPALAGAPAPIAPEGGETTIDARKREEAARSASSPSSEADANAVDGGTARMSGSARQSVQGAAPSAPGSNPPAPRRPGVADTRVAPAEPAFDGARFSTRAPNGVVAVAEQPVTTFSLDVDTTSYAVTRRALTQGRLPPASAVRVEEIVNYFPYAYPKPESLDPPFLPTLTVAPSPWARGRQIVHVAIKGYEPARRPPANIVLLIDVSGSMQPADRLPLIKSAFSMFVESLAPSDTVSIVTYASGSGVALAPTPASDTATIKAAIARLQAGGSTSGAAGLADAYRLARQSYKADGVNRILLATDGDFNVGPSSPQELKAMVERERRGGVSLSVLGVGQDNYHDSIAQALAQNGDGAAAYVDTIDEARKVLVEQSAAALTPIANDVKVQIEWNPARVSDYRLIGYEKRALRNHDFADDRVDAGDVGAGHTVTAIYEITPAGSPSATGPSRYRPEAPATTPAVRPDELGFLRMRYKTPGQTASRLIETPISAGAAAPSLAATSDDVRFSLAAAGFGQLLRGEDLGGWSYYDALALAQGARGADPNGYRAEFLKLVRLARSLSR
jgi:Ca-activated chloride channel family protein